VAERFCDAGKLWFRPCSQAATRLAIQGRVSRFDQLGKFPVCDRHAKRIKGAPLWVIRDLEEETRG
jgi:hypothetical protein